MVAPRLQAWMRLAKPSRGRPVHGIRLHRLLAGLRAPGCAGHRHGCRAGGGGARQRNTEALGLADRVAVRSARWVRHRREAHGHLRRPWSPTRPTCPPPLWLAFRARWPISSRRSPWTGAPDGLDLFRPLAQWAARALKPGGVLACDAYEGHMDAARAVAEQAGFVDVHIVDDLTGRPRVLVAKR